MGPVSKVPWCWRMSSPCPTGCLGMLPFSLVLFWCHQDDGDKDQELALMYLNPLLSLPCQKGPRKAHLFLPGRTRMQSPRSSRTGSSCSTLYLISSKGAKLWRAEEEKSVCRRETQDKKGWEDIFAYSVCRYPLVKTHGSHHTQSQHLA